VDTHTAVDDLLEPWPLVEQLTRTLRVRSDDAAALVEVLCAEAVRTVPGARDAGVIVTGTRRRLRTVSATGEAPRQLDETQQRTGRGPCLTAARKQIVVRIHDIATDDRWPPFRTAAVEAGVASMLCVPLFVEDRTLGTLSLYADRPNSLRDESEPVARVLATLAAVALAEAHQRARMEQALHNRDLIGQAKGILMHARGISADAAFRVLGDTSQRTNRKLLDVAARLVETGTLD
jgi:GAF domain-containing protein